MIATIALKVKKRLTNPYLSLTPHFVKEFSVQNRPLRRILVIRTGAIGDLIVMLPSLRAIKEHHPPVHLELLGTQSVLQLALRPHHADRIHSIEQRGLTTFYAQEGTLDPEWVEFFNGFDLIVACSVETASPLIANLRRSGSRRVLALPPFPPSTDATLHMVDYYLQAIEPLGFRTTHRTPKLTLSNREKEWARAFFAQQIRSHEKPARVIALHPGSGGKGKRWPAERFAQLADWALAELQAAILIIAGPAEPGLAKWVAHQMSRGKPILLEDEQLLHTAAALDYCQAFVGNDSGITHLASALGTPSLAIFGPTDPRIWGPRGEKTMVLSSQQMSCPPCPYGEPSACLPPRCLESLPVDQVADELKHLMDRWAKKTDD